MAVKIAITPETPSKLEPSFIRHLVDDEGFDLIHLRHPGLSLREMLLLIQEIPQRLHNRLHLHGHFDLVNEFNLGGIHLNRRCPSPPEGYKGCLSASCHSLEDVRRCHEAGLDYVTLSPIFDSLSKPGYRSAFTEKELKRLDSFGDFPIIALGGITQDNVERLNKYNFAGYAMLGAINWGN